MIIAPGQIQMPHKEDEPDYGFHAPFSRSGRYAQSAAGQQA